MFCLYELSLICLKEEKTVEEFIQIIEKSPILNTPEAKKNYVQSVTCILEYDQLLEAFEGSKTFSRVLIGQTEFTLDFNRLIFFYTLIIGLLDSHLSINSLLLTSQLFTRRTEQFAEEKDSIPQFYLLQIDMALYCSLCRLTQNNEIIDKESTQKLKEIILTTLAIFNKGEPLDYSNNEISLIKNFFNYIEFCQEQEEFVDILAAFKEKLPNFASSKSARNGLVAQ